MDYSNSDIAFGIDIGGSGIKGAPVNVKTGVLLDDRYRLPTPRPATPEAVAGAIREILTRFEVPAHATVGVTFPGIIQHGVCRSAVNMDGDWIDRNLVELLREHVGIEATVLNDADAAGYAETLYGAGQNISGMVLTITLGTGIGSALVNDGRLVPNLELGHLEIDGYDAETRAAASIKDREGLSYEEWAVRLQRYFEVVEFLFSPDLFIVGGGVSKDHKKFMPLIKTRAEMIPAELRNHAGIVGAGSFAVHQRG